MQLRFACEYTGEEYVREQGWLKASLPTCPLHPHGGCGLARHGTYARVSPPGTLIARWYCPEGRCTFSLLPEHFVGWEATLAGFGERLEVADVLVALFRYKVIAELLPQPKGALGLYARIEEKAARDYTIPGGTRIAAETIRHWLKAYRAGGLDALLPKARADRGRTRTLPAAVAEALLATGTCRWSAPGSASR